MAEKRIISKTKKITLPLIPLRGLVVFPYMILHFDIARRKSIASLEKAMLENKQVFLVAQKNIETEQPTFEELHSFGVVANVKQLLKLPNGNIHVLVEGVNRGKLIQFEKNEKYITALVRTYQEPDIDVDDLEVSALVRKIKSQFDDFAQLNTKISKESAIAVLNINEPGELSDIIASNVLTEIDDKLEILSETKPLSRIKKLISIMEREIEIAEIENNISNKVREELEKNQKEYYLKEQLKAIQEELDGGFGEKQELEKFEQQLDALPIPEVSKNKLKTDVKRLSRLQPMSPDSSVLRTYIETVLSLPWDKSTKESINLKKVKSILDRDHYGLDKVKERIIEFLAVKQLRGDIKGNIICLVGPPGVGKTSVAKSIATAIGRNYVRLSLGGVKDESEIRGHRKTYVGSMPGKIISALIQAESNNPLILLDEVDKLSSSYNGDPAAALLEVLDSEQNYSFKDHYIEVPFDLSKVMFIVTANTLDTISKPLLDRMEV
ncbi:MAG: LON peptidase substrate-binding domain-containing protein, partial [Clostridia bacterium]|nr:LON peptidase substrate-binding domain-containing protein [Clostridia bacterium]